MLFLENDFIHNLGTTSKHTGRNLWAGTTWIGLGEQAADAGARHAGSVAIIGLWDRNNGREPHNQHHPHGGNALVSKETIG